MTHDDAIRYAGNLIARDFNGTPTYYDGGSCGRDDCGTYVIDVPIYVGDDCYVVTVWQENDGIVYGEY